MSKESLYVPKSSTQSSLTSIINDIITQQNHTITGIKTFSTAPIISTISNTGTLTLPTTTGTLALVSQIPTNTSYVDLTTNQTIAGIKTFSNQISVADGSVSAPSIRFSSETNSGIYRSGASSLDISIAGVRTLGISTGNITLPSSRLTFSGNLSYTASGSSGAVISSNSQTINDPTSSGTVANHYSHFLNRKTLTGTNTTTYTNSYQLFIDAPPLASTNITLTNRYTLGMNWGSIINQDSGGLGGQIIFPGGNQSAPTYTFTGNTNTGMYSGGSNNIDFSCATNKIVNISSSGLTMSAGKPLIFIPTSFSKTYQVSAPDINYNISLTFPSYTIDTVGDSLVATAATQTLSNKTMATLKVGSSGTSYAQFLSGSFTIGSLAAQAGTTNTVNFSNAFASAPNVLAMVCATSAIGSFQNFLIVSAFSVGTSSAIINVVNSHTISTAATGARIVWFAFI